MTRLLACATLWISGIGFPITSPAEDHTLRLEIVDSVSGSPLAARVYLESETGDAVFLSSELPGTAVKYDKQNRLNANSVERHTTVSAHPCYARLSNGAYSIVVERGKTCFPFEKRILIEDGDVDVRVPLVRWDDPMSRGWYSGDTHLHRSVDDLKNVIAAEDLNVALPLTNWVTRSGTPPSSGNRNLTQIPEGLVQVDPLHVIWPRNTEYEIFSVGKHRHTLGALFVLGHRQGLGIGVPPWRPAIESAMETDPDALFDMDKLDWPFSMVLPVIAPDALYELSNNHVWRTEFAFREWNSRAPGYIQPPFGRSEGGHRRWLDYTHGMYYALLNCGLRLPPSAGTANGVHPVPAGFGRVYVHLPDGFEFRKWMKNLKLGRSFVTTGPMLYATADSEVSGHEFSSDGSKEIQIDMKVISDQKLSYGELIVNGRPETLLRPKNTKMTHGAYHSNLSTIVTPRRSGWFAVRFWQPMPDGQSRFVHSAPWYVTVNDEPVKPRHEDRSFLARRVTEEIIRSEKLLSNASVDEYRQAQAFYSTKQVLDESDWIEANSRPLSSDVRDEWLDNMIIQHRFTAHEVRRATGLSVADAQREIDARVDAKPKRGFHVLPYPGGRHPRIGFLDGAIAPQRDTKISVFPPWNDGEKEGGYVVIDVPEAVFSNLGLTYLAHTHIPTIWDDRSIQLEPTEWRRSGNNYTSVRRLPNGIVISSHVESVDDHLAMRIELHNGTSNKLTGMRVQVCAMLKGAVGFNTQEQHWAINIDPFIAIRSERQNRWIITGWQPLDRSWTNPPVPCFHSDPIFPDCEPGQSVSVTGGLWFYQGDAIESYINTLTLP